MPSDEPFLEFMRAFARHEYSLCAETGPDLLSQHMYLWVVHFWLISLERDYQFETLEKAAPLAIRSFDDPWSISSLQLTLGKCDPTQLLPLIGNRRQACQFGFFTAEALLTRGEREEAQPLFESCKQFELECPEGFVAKAELENPEPHTKTFERLVYKAVYLKRAGRQEEALEARGRARAYFEKFTDEISRSESTSDLLFGLWEVFGEEAKDSNGKAFIVDIRKFEKPQETTSTIEEETTFFRNKYCPAFTSFRGRGKRIGKNMSLLEQVALSFAFPGFVGRTTLDKSGAREPEYADSIRKSSTYDETIERQLQYRKYFRRRYSGDITAPLSRRKYCALYSESSTNPTYTLLGEMNAYANPLIGCCVAVANPDSNSVSIKLLGLPEEPNPLYLFVNNPEQYTQFDDAPGDPRHLISGDLRASVQAVTELSIDVPCEDVKLEIEDALDLRQPAARQWMVEFFKNPPPCETYDDLSHGQLLKRVAEEYQFDLTQVCDWYSLLPVTDCGNPGGTGMAELFAGFIRRLGCQALIFPSARCDYGTVIRSGELLDHWGWNLVEYRGSPIPTRVSFEEYSPLEEYSGLQAYAEIQEGPYSGSILRVGGSARGRIKREIALQEFFLMHGSEWRARHNQEELVARSFSWYESTHKLSNTDPIYAICLSCRAKLLLHEVLPLRECPKCGLRGDLDYWPEIPRFFLEHMTAPR